MPLYTFREKRNRKYRSIDSSGDVVSAVNGLTIYPWSFELVDVRKSFTSPPILDNKVHIGEILNVPMIDLEIFEDYAATEKARSDERFKDWELKR